MPRSDEWWNKLLECGISVKPRYYLTANPIDLNILAYCYFYELLSKICISNNLYNCYILVVLISV